MKLSFHICNTPCAEEYYMGVNATYKAYIVDVPDELFPAELLRVLKPARPSEIRILSEL